MIDLHAPRERQRRRGIAGGNPGRLGGSACGRICGGAGGSQFGVRQKTARTHVPGAIIRCRVEKTNSVPAESDQQLIGYLPIASFRNSFYFFSESEQRVRWVLFFSF
jgi:hypothetical protein